MHAAFRMWDAFFYFQPLEWRKWWGDLRLVVVVCRRGGGDAGWAELGDDVRAGMKRGWTDGRLWYSK